MCGAAVRGPREVWSVGPRYPLIRSLLQDWAQRINSKPGTGEWGGVYCCRKSRGKPLIFAGLYLLAYACWLCTSSAEIEPAEMPISGSSQLIRQGQLTNRIAHVADNQYYRAKNGAAARAMQAPGTCQISLAQTCLLVEDTT